MANRCRRDAGVRFHQLRTYCADVRRSVPILLQKSFSTADQNFSSPLVRFADKYVREKLTGDFANGLGAILNGEHSLASFLSKKSSRSIFGLLQQYLPGADIVRCSNYLVGDASIWTLQARAERSRVDSQIRSVSHQTHRTRDATLDAAASRRRTEIRPSPASLDRAV